MLSVRAHSKQMAELGQVSDEVLIYTLHTKLSVPGEEVFTELCC